MPFIPQSLFPSFFPDIKTHLTNLVFSNTLGENNTPDLNTQYHPILPTSPICSELPKVSPSWLSSPAPL